MNIYLIKNMFNINKGILPYYYIGSDTKDRFLITEYHGSSIWLNNDILKLDIKNFEKIILWKGNSKQITDIEEIYHKRFNVLSKYFYNKCIANGHFCTQGKANYFYLDDPNKKIINLPTNHIDVLTGKVVGMNYKKEWTEETKQLWSKQRKGIKKTKNHIQKLKKPKKNKENYKGKKSESHKQSMKKPKSEEHKLSLSNSSKVKRKIEWYDINFNLLKAFDSIKEASEHLLEVTNKKSFNGARSGLSDCCRGIQKTYSGYIFKYAS